MGPIRQSFGMRLSFLTKHSFVDNDVYLFVKPLPNDKGAIYGGAATKSNIPYTSEGLLVQTDSVGDTVAVLRGSPNHQSIFKTAVKLLNGTYLIGGESNEAPNATTPAATLFKYDPVSMAISEALFFKDNNGLDPDQVRDLFYDDFISDIRFLLSQGGNSIIGKLVGDTIVKAKSIFNLDAQQHLQIPGGDYITVGGRSSGIGIFKTDDTTLNAKASRYIYQSGAQLQAADVLVDDSTIKVLGNLTEFGPTGPVFDQVLINMDLDLNLIEATRFSRPGGALFNPGSNQLDDSTIQVNLILAGSNGHQQGGLGLLKLNSLQLNMFGYNPEGLSMELRDVANMEDHGFLAVGSTIRTRQQLCYRCDCFYC